MKVGVADYNKNVHIEKFLYIFNKINLILERMKNMGIIKAAINSIGGSFADQWLEYIKAGKDGWKHNS